MTQNTVDIGSLTVGIQDLGQKQKLTKINIFFNFFRINTRVIGEMTKNGHFYRGYRASRVGIAQVYGQSHTKPKLTKITIFSRFWV